MMKAGFWHYVRAAFSYRPMGMFVAPNWVALGAFGLLGGWLDPGYWLLGAGVELGYLYLMSTNPRFQRAIDSQSTFVNQGEWEKKLSTLLGNLELNDRERYHALAQRCQGIIQQQTQGPDSNPALDAQGDSLARLLWVYLRLLFTRQSIHRVLKESAPAGRGEKLEDRVEALQRQLADKSIGDELRRSLAGQIEILQQRMAKQREAREKLAFLDAELVRIQEQVELIREQAVLSTDPQSVSQRIDQITTTLGGTTQWIQEQQQIYGRTEDLLTDAPPITMRSMVRERAS